MGWLIGCVLIVTIIALYFPLIHIRLMNKVLKTLQQIEVNTRK
jgi:hypothetical protein